jgi:hypothetical protein
MANKPMSVKTLRTMVSNNSTPITNRELAEASRLMDFKSYWNLDHSSDFVITKDKEERDELYDNMCCGTCSKNILLSSNQTLYFACSYGH